MGSIYGTVLLFDTLLPMKDLQKLTFHFAPFDTISPICYSENVAGG